MKKSILFSFALIPLLMSCNNNSKGFIDPFPDDKYSAIGFRIASDEMVSRSLLSEESALVDATVDNKDRINHYITKVHGEVHERNYERAFAGVFRQGYNISNRMYDDEFDIIRYGEKTNGDPTYTCRQERDGTSTTVVDYSYGKSEVTSTTKTVRYLAKLNDAKYEESTNDECEIAAEQVLEKVGEGSTEEDYVFVSAKKLGDKSETLDPWYEPYIIIEQTDYIFKIGETTSIPGATKDNVVLVKEEHAPYDKGEKSGIYSLPDGREYQAMINSITVTQLTKETFSDENAEEIEGYLVSKVRKYSETAITSDIIQPNVPVSYLSKPIVINFTEEIYKFSAEKITTLSNFALDPVEIK